jgi:hypothetical protein
MTTTETKTAQSCCTDPLTIAERRVLAIELDSAARRLRGAAEPRRMNVGIDETFEHGTRLLAAWDEMCSLLSDVQAAAGAGSGTAARAELEAGS